ncbi:hypothetical protein PCH_Pc21g07800 [Penicillium rubens Wisconsin 54-1255]|uniref:Uncharacterized protein n=1 Tax=Penicillium rubens (strain ATCC 28089 / DSM 1075 / NRRL 1951 / Wisconsin 54-1255) TaxID=500485 RepID=B6HL74_PENRW|nr:hypothetical protein PCH_Pc21g07800 [Penicillium rubens Wisconsin 54-1255]
MHMRGPNEQSTLYVGLGRTESESESRSWKSHDEAHPRQYLCRRSGGSREHRGRSDPRFPARGFLGIESTAVPVPKLIHALVLASSLAISGSDRVPRAAFRKFNPLEEVRDLDAAKCIAFAFVELDLCVEKCALKKLGPNIVKSTAPICPGGRFQNTSRSFHASNM